MDPATLAAVKDLLVNVGFAAAVTAFVLWRLDSRIGELRDAVRDLAGIMGAHRRRDDTPDPPAPR